MSDARGLWAASAAETFVSGPLDGDRECDLAIVGGGFTGCSAALAAAEAGARVVLCEAQTIGHDGVGRGLHLNWARRKLAQLFAPIGDMPFEHDWHGQIAMTHDKVPKILKLGPQAFAVMGYSGRGIAPGTVLGRAVALHLLDALHEQLPLDPVDGYSEPGAGVRTWVYETGARLVHGLPKI
jgi:glycine/D-amino acid oxidase-like deaminating enzyme